MPDRKSTADARGISKKVGGRRHILVTGAPRSGTTFLGKMLSLPREVGYVREPFNFEYGLDGITQYFPYLEPGIPEEKQYQRLIESLLEGRAVFKKLPEEEATSLLQRLGRRFFGGGSAFSYFMAVHDPRVRRLLIKDPLASLASEYFLRNFPAEVVVIMRHPAATVASMKRLGWGHDFSHFTNQKRLMQKYLAPILKDYDVARLSELEAQALLWLCVNTVLDSFLKNNPEMIFITHEELSASPEKKFRGVYSQLGLEFTEEIQGAIRAHTSRSNPIDPTNNDAHVLQRDSRRNIDRWKKLLSPEEVRRIREITGALASKYFDDISWSLD